MPRRKVTANSNPESEPSPSLKKARVNIHLTLAPGTNLEVSLDAKNERGEPIESKVVRFHNDEIPISTYQDTQETFIKKAKDCGVDGVIVPDLPPEEADELWQPARASGLDQIFLLAPTSDERRVKKVLRKASGFVYYVSMTGVTGSKAITPTDIQPMVEGLRARCGLPVGVGFGITSPEQAAIVAGFADAVIVGTAIMRRVEEARENAEKVASAAAFLRDLKQAVRQARTPLSRIR